MKRKKRNQLIVRAVKSQPCVDCCKSYPYYVMDFDHREGDSKAKCVNQLMSGTLGKLYTEIDKCDVVCANCHRVRTHFRRIYKVGKET